MASYSYEKDLEKHPAEVGVGNIDSSKRPSYVYEDGAVPGEAFELGDSWTAKLQRLAGRFKIEQRGIERVPETERTDTSLLNIASMVSHSLMIVTQILYLGAYWENVPCFDYSFKESFKICCR